MRMPPAVPSGRAVVASSSAAAAEIWGISGLGLSLVNHPHMPTLTQNEPNGPTIQWRVAQQRVLCLCPSPDAALRLCA
ncbi:unknown protein [Oryza sativa Japonica Group]|uniref:Os01g0719200 protein n=2 Tax=Oryza sativa subsp. japonica TaxID=39947 RepID=A0A0P0V7K4_ORYSJ|nr:hypothetical protein EE612_005378 [Oryza sativa]BAD87762.1 unknown protein [Oryza sativa Japonica Group]BAH91270.1 Os01g0719200 [Oryza sativa Japonica Group]BAS74061.1 Os01g0719150 [Oryza sativa Japonica Group]|eukprot:NP_001172540.1 Os01g0719200 [Oryza sativa Japonica Group]